jgi:hypothetical protein
LAPKAVQKPRLSSGLSTHGYGTSAATCSGDCSSRYQVRGTATPSASQARYSDVLDSAPLHDVDAEELER